MPGPSLRLDLQIGARSVHPPSSAQVRRWVKAALKRPGEITVRIVGTAEARRLNRRYRGDDHATNVLSFPYVLSRSQVQGDIVLCGPVVVREARSQRKTLEAHFAHLVIHAALHLQGYDHVRRRDAERMEAIERRLLSKLGYPDPYSTTG